MILRATAESITLAAKLIRQGKLVAFPTETIYGLGGDATNAAAVAAVFAAKERSFSRPLIVHFASKKAAATEVEFNPCAEKLANDFWPGPLTMILPRRQNCTISPMTVNGEDNLGVRVPADDVALALLREATCPLTASSANHSGGASPTIAADVARSLGDSVNIILDGGQCRLGIASTIVDLSKTTPVILRLGAISEDAINACLYADEQ